MKHVSNEEKAREIVEQYETRYNTCDLLWQDLEDVALQAMKWKDKERKELWRITRNHYQEWAEEQIAKEKQKLIEKACEKYCNCCGSAYMACRRYNYDKLHCKRYLKFKKAMEE